MNGIILYQGPSVIDGSPIVAIAIGLLDGGSNKKTGPMVQIYILRSDVNPLKAVQTGEDISICGNCRHRGKLTVDEETGIRKNIERTCYVTLMHGPRVVYSAFAAGSYRDVPINRASRLLARKNVRLGAYGDPAAVPFAVWEAALGQAGAVNGYTHLWKRYPELSAFCMASCDTPEEREEAKALGFRVYRVRSKDDPVLKGEGICPASEELGKTVQCVSCMLCGGNSTKAKADITIMVHGTGRNNFAKSFA
jgi:hypothetical protein